MSMEFNFPMPGHVIERYCSIHSLNLASNSLINVWQEQLLSSSQESTSPKKKTCFEKTCFEKICFEKTCILREQIHSQ